MTALQKRLEKEIKAVYSKAHTEIKGKIAKIQVELDATESTDPRTRYLLLKKQRLKNIESQIANIELNAERTAMQMIDEYMVAVYKGTYNASAEQLGFSLVDNGAVKKILTGEENPFVKIKALTDHDEITAKMKSEFMTGLLQGESMPKLARRFKQVGEGYLKKTIRIARTETMRVTNSAKMDVAKHGEDLGYRVRKRWVATHDDRTRDDHLAMDGVSVDVNEPFILPDGSKMMFPCDISMGADAGQVINCRCTMVEELLRDEHGNLIIDRR